MKFHKTHVFDSNQLLLHNGYKKETINFEGMDSRKIWKKNRRRLGENWYYFQQNISYTFNSLGYRTIEDKDTQVNNFICFGCSHTMGVGIKEEHRYSNLLEKSCNMQNKNFGAGGGSVDLIWYNNFLYNKNCNLKPKFVVFQWPSLFRLTLPADNNIIKCMPGFHRIKLFPSFISEKRYVYNVSKMYYNYCNEIWNMQGIKTINFSLDKWTSDLFKIPCLTKFWDQDEYELARDLHHPGISTNRKIADWIASEL